MQLNPIGAPQHLKQTGTLLLPVTPTAALGPAAYIPGLAAFTVGSLLYPNTATTIAQLLAVAVNQVLVSGGVATAPAWSGTPTLAGITCTAINPLTTPAESWIGPSSTTGIYFKGGNVGIGTTNPGTAKLAIGNNTSYDLYSIVNGYDSVVSANLNLVFGIYGKSASSVVRGGFLGTTTAHPFEFRTNNYKRLVIESGSTSGDEWVHINSTGNVGIGTTSPTNLLSLGGNAARIFWMERHKTANNAGNSLTMQAGGATVAATNKVGGQLILLPGLSTGSAESGVTIQGCVAGGTGTGDNSLQDMIKVLGNKLGVFNTTPVVQQNHIADASGGATVDAEARAAINAALLVLETYGWLKAA